uniref:Uncharacterized protein n=1 Tax=Arundo donax TaxID=35708 RepID=A0A0A9GNS3_ARUDO
MDPTTKQEKVYSNIKSDLNCRSVANRNHSEDYLEMIGSVCMVS